MKDQNFAAKSSPLEVFLQLLSIITLYMSVTSLLTLLFQYIDLQQNPILYATNLLQSWMRLPMASLMVGFPIYFYTQRKYRTLTQGNPNANTFKIRIWLNYSTLFVASLFMIGDLANLLYRFLGSEFNFVFLIKPVLLFLVCALVFYYYLRDIKQNWQKTQLIIFSGFVWLFVLATIGYGLFLSHSALNKAPSASYSAPGSTLNFPTQSGNLNFNWESMPAAGMPANAFAAAKDLYICQGKWQGNNYPGQYVKGVCRLSYGGAVYDVKSFVILTHQPQDAGEWLASTHSLNIKPIYGGFENGQPLAICRINLNGTVHIGKVVSGNFCDIALLNQEVSFRAYEILYPQSLPNK